MKPWTPKVVVTRRIAGRLLRAYRGDAIELTLLEKQACIDAITSKFLSNSARKKMGAMWLHHGPGILQIGWQDANPNPQVDPVLDALAAPER